MELRRAFLILVLGYCLVQGRVWPTWMPEFLAVTACYLPGVCLLAGLLFRDRIAQVHRAAGVFLGLAFLMGIASAIEIASLSQAGTSMIAGLVGIGMGLPHWTVGVWRGWELARVWSALWMITLAIMGSTIEWHFAPGIAVFGAGLPAFFAVLLRPAWGPPLALGYCLFLGGLAMGELWIRRDADSLIYQLFPLAVYMRYREMARYERERCEWPGWMGDEPQRSQ